MDQRIQGADDLAEGFRCAFQMPGGVLALLAELALQAVAEINELTVAWFRFEHGFLRPDDTFIETIELAGVGADKQHQVGTVADFGQAGGHPATRLQDAVVVADGLAMHVIKHSTRAFRQRHGGTHAANVGCQSCQQRLPGLTQNAGRRCNSFIQ